MRAKAETELVPKDSYEITVSSCSIINVSETVVLFNAKCLQLEKDGVINKKVAQFIYSEIYQLRILKNCSIEYFWKQVNEKAPKILEYLLVDFEEASDLYAERKNRIVFIEETYTITRTEVDEAFVAYEISGALNGLITVNFDNEEYTGGIYYQNHPYQEDEEGNVEEVDVEWSNVENNELYNEIEKYAISDYNELYLGL